LRRVKDWLGLRKRESWSTNRKCWKIWKKPGNNSFWTERGDWQSKLNRKGTNSLGLFRSKEKFRNRKRELKRRRKDS
jgi:hypothetical protein